MGNAEMLKKVRRWSGKNLLLILTMISVVFGIIVGGSLREANLTKDTIRYIAFPGELFMNMLKCMVLPLIAASIISGLSQLDGKTSGRLGSRAVLYYVLTTSHAVILGIIIVMVIHPGDPSIKSLSEGVEEHANVSTVDKFLDLFRNAFPENIMRSTFQQQQTSFQTVDDHGLTVSKRVTHYVDGTNVLGVIVFCIVMGLMISKIGEEAKPLANLFGALDVVITKMVSLIMWTGPIGIPSLIAAKMLEVNDLWRTGQMLLMFILTVVIGLAIQCFGTLPLIFFIGTRQNPYVFLKGLGQAVLTAFGTASSAASLPITFRCLNELGIDPRVTKFVLPVGAMVNMDGTALYEATASIFIAQLNGLEMTIGQIITVSITATLASIGAASIPSAGLVTMLIVLTALGLPASDISLIVSIDWFLDRLRTATNVVGDAYGCGFVHYICKEHLTEDIKEAEKYHTHNEAHGVDFDKLQADLEKENVVEKV